MKKSKLILATIGCLLLATTIPLALAVNYFPPATPQTAIPTFQVDPLTGKPGVSGSSVTQGSTGTDFSANAATIPMAGFVLLATIPVTASRVAVEVQNQSSGTLQVVRDDGAGGNQTTKLLGPGFGSGTQGGEWASTTFKGRIRVYGASGAQFGADQD